MISVSEYLKNDKEEMPKWLKEYNKESILNFNEILSHRIVYYPGAYTDGQPIRTFNKARYAHTFMYVDYMVEKEDTIKELSIKDAFKGYELYDIRDVDDKQLTPKGWSPSINLPLIDYGRTTFKAKPYCVIAIFNRKSTFGDEHGNERFALIYLAADGIATYDAIFANYNRAPAVILLQDHGLGGNYDRFGKGGLMEKIAIATNTFPKYIMCEIQKNTAWHSYELVKDVMCEIGGMHKNRRYLWIKK